MKESLQFLFFLAHKLRFVWVALLCVMGFVYISFHDFENVAHRIAHTHFTQKNTEHTPQNLFCESMETKECEDDDSEPNGAHLSPLAYQPKNVFFTKKQRSFPPFIACFEHEAIEQETPPPDSV